MKGTLIDAIPSSSSSSPFFSSLLHCQSHLHLHPPQGERVKRPTDCLFGVSTNRHRPSRTCKDLSPKTGVVKTVH